MNIEEKNRLTRKIYISGIIIPVIVFYILATMSVIFIFRFNASMMLAYLYAALAAMAIAFPPAFIVLVYLVRRVRRVLEEATGGDIHKVSLDSKSSLKAIDDFPFTGALLASFAALVAAVVEALFIYFMGGYNGGLSLCFVILSLDLVLATGYFEFFVLYRIMEPARKVAYASFDYRGYRGGVSLRARIIALPTILTVSVLTLGWTVAVNSSILSKKDYMLESGLDKIKILAMEIDTERIGADDWIDRETAEESTEDENGMLLLLNGRDRVVEEVGTLEGADEDSITDLISKLEESGESTASNDSMTLGAAITAVGDSNYKLAWVFDPDVFGGDFMALTIIYLIITLTVIMVAIILTKLTLESITDPLKRLKEAANLVSEGDLTIKVEVASSDEIGALSVAFSSMIASLHSISSRSLDAAEETSGGATGVTATAEEVQASLDQLTSIIQQLAENASREASMAEEVYSLTTEICEALESSSSQADMGVEVSQTSSTLAEEGRKDAMAAIERMGKVRESIDETARVIRSLGEQSDEIEIIVELINNIADQTNLLALNAAIEAARAQEHGRGFSVVAEEVRKLAEESTQSTSRISSLVRDIQKNTSVAVEATQKGTEEVSAGMKAVEVAGDTLDKIYDFILKAEEVSATIAETSQRHLELGNRIMKSMEDIRNIAEQNASSTEEISASAEEQSAAMQELTSTSVQLSSLAEEMKKMVEKYRLEN
ncbi:MAG: HAMP domain-containing methyl-accepting chemotaxis protein [Actinomycetota bacterium]|nr:HAMP domain-containing methyl-accepting chemotaxis protein [Actinomycetota bacterium]